MSYQAVILTVSDSCAAGTRTDTSGPAIRGMLENAGFAVQAMQTGRNVKQVQQPQKRLLEFSSRGIFWGES